MESLELKKLLNEIGDTVHSMNTIAVGLSKLNTKNLDVPDGLDISWSPKNIEKSKNISRSYAERAALIYSVESIYEYLDSISSHPLWWSDNINFKGDEKKALKVYNFLQRIPSIREEQQLLAELACHWRNRIVHKNSSNAKLSSSKVDRLNSLKEYIYNNYYHFDIEIALKNFNHNKVTLKDSSTLATMLIKSARLVDKFFFNSISLIENNERLINHLKSQPNFIKIFNQQQSVKRNRQLLTYIQMSFPFLKVEIVKSILEELNNNSNIAI